MEKVLMDLYKRLNRMMDDPGFRDRMIEDHKRKLEWRKKSYFQKLKSYEDKPGWIVEFRIEGDRSSGWTAYRRDSEKGRKLVLKKLREKKDLERKIFESENPLDAALDKVLGMGVESIDRVGLRKISDQFMGFDQDRFSEFCTLVTDEGIEVK